MGIFTKEKVEEELMMLNETANNESSLKSQASRFYEHVLKWIYQPANRKGGWVTSITRAMIDIYNILFNPNTKSTNKTLINKVNPMLKDAFEKAKNKAYNDTNIADILNNTEVYNKFKKLDNIIGIKTNLNNVVDYLMDNLGDYPDTIQYLRNNDTIEADYNGKYRKDIFGDEE